VMKLCSVKRKTNKSRRFAVNMVRGGVGNGNWETNLAGNLRMGTGAAAMRDGTLWKNDRIAAAAEGAAGGVWHSAGAGGGGFFCRSAWGCCGGGLFLCGLRCGRRLPFPSAFCWRWILPVCCCRSCWRLRCMKRVIFWRCGTAAWRSHSCRSVSPGRCCTRRRWSGGRPASQPLPDLR